MIAATILSMECESVIMAYQICNTYLLLMCSCLYPRTCELFQIIKIKIKFGLVMCELRNYEVFIY